MAANRSLIFILTITLTTLACGLQPGSNSPEVAPATITIPAPTALPGLSVEQVKNAQYKLGVRDDHASVQLTDGKFQQGTDNTTLDFARVDMIDSVSLGDLTGDGVNEGATVVYENYGGTGEFGFLTIYSNQNGTPAFVTSSMIDDRPQVGEVTIENGEVKLDAVIHGINDPGCCPALQTFQWYRLVGTTLRLSKYISNSPDGQPHEIVISGPYSGDASQSVHLTGTITMAPFENTLSYHLTDISGTDLISGPIPVTAPDPGAPGTFDATIDLTVIPANSTIFLEVRDLSAADGSTIAMDSVQLTVK